MTAWNRTRLAIVLAAVAAAAQARAQDGNAQLPAANADALAAFDWRLLETDPAALLGKSFAPNKAPRAGASAPGIAWDRAVNADGTTALTVKQPVTSFWDTRIGADVTLTEQMPATSSGLLQQRIARDNQIAQSSGSAWAQMTTPGFSFLFDKAAIEARFDPTDDQTKIGTSFSKALPLPDDHYSLTLQNGYNVVQQAPFSLSGRAARSYEVDRSAKLSFNDTGTSVFAGQTLSTTDDRWLNRIGAEQKLFGGVSITGTVSETAEGIANRTVTAGFKHSW